MKGLARMIFAKNLPPPPDEGGGEGAGDDMPMDEELPEGDMGMLEGAGDVAGKAFGEAVKSGDGAAIKSAFKALLDECNSEQEESYGKLE